ncbi:hypothetical protein QBC38DRAFT_519416 [Podospora fimiseda]|uniref:Protein kinase domain-containing protein n=1 Tax=Podospora fimiseda TaxID=252190 RepID=A0AAN6YN49_9PEZI|nr:hypothetical protein QBC38DRAFT_519416 [Podospora fimiseda]
MSSSLPYFTGQRLEIHQHTPPDVFGVHHEVPFGDCTEREWNGYYIKSVAQLELMDDRLLFAVQHPPIETEINQPAKKKTLEIQSVIHDNSFILLVCKVDDNSHLEGCSIIAKVYDGVFHPEQDSMHDHLAPDPMTRADLHYSFESLAYEEIDRAGHCDDQGNMRTVRMILLEEVEGAHTMGEIIRGASSKQLVKPDWWDDEEDPWPPVADLDSEYMDMEWEELVLDRDLLPALPDRLQVLQNVLVAFDLIWWDVQVKYFDICPDDVLIRPDNTVAIINFEGSIPYQYVESEPDLAYQNFPDHPKQEPHTPKLARGPNPMRQHWPYSKGQWDAGFPVVAGEPEILPTDERSKSIWWQWVPQNWLDDPEEAAIWLCQSVRTADPSRFSPIPKDWLNQQLHNNRSKGVLGMLENLGRDIDKISGDIKNNTDDISENPGDIKKNTDDSPGHDNDSI